MYMPFLLTIGDTTRVKLNVTSETDQKANASAPYAELYVGSSIEFDVAGADIYVGPDNQVATTGNSYSNPSPGKRGRKYVMGSHVELHLEPGEDLYAICATGLTATVEGSQVGV